MYAIISVVLDRHDNVLIEQGTIFQSLIAIMRKDSSQSPTHFFGTAAAEKNKFSPGQLESSQSLNFIQGIFEIAIFLEERLKIKGLSHGIISDLGNYSYPLLSVQSRKPFSEFSKYYLSLASRGLWKNPYFHLYFIGLSLLGADLCTRGIVFLKSWLKRTPTLGNISSGRKIQEK